MSSMLSAPAAMPATSEDTFNPASAPLSVGTLIRSSASSRSPALRASAISGTKPAADILRRRCRCRRVRIGVSVRDRVKVGGGCGGMSSSVSSPPSRLLSDELWPRVEPLILPRPPAVHGRTGRPRTSDRDVLEGIAFVLSTGIGWTKLPRELGYGSGWTCWRRMRQWHEAGVFDRLHQAVLDQLGEHGRLDWSRASLDSVSVRAKRGVH